MRPTRGPAPTSRPVLAALATSALLLAACGGSSGVTVERSEDSDATSVDSPDDTDTADTTDTTDPTDPTDSTAP